MVVGSFGGFALLLGTPDQPVAHANTLQHQHSVFKLHVPLSLTAQLAFRGVDPARLQRATEGAGESTGCGGHQIIERGGVIGKEAGRCPVVFAHLVVRSEEDRFRLNRQVGTPDRAPIANDPDLRNVSRLIKSKH